MRRRGSLSLVTACALAVHGCGAASSEPRGAGGSRERVLPSASAASTGAAGERPGAEPSRLETPAPGAPPASARWWEAGDAACPAGTRLDRTPSPEGDPVILCRRADGVPHGPATLFYPNGRREMEGEYREGKPAGVWRHFDEDGTPTKTERHGAR